MCGRFTVTATADELLNRFGVVINSNLKPRWNVAPSQKSPIISANGFTRDCHMAHFGLEGVIAHKTLINARSETIAEKPTFKQAFEASRCLVIASGWYEWKGKKNPYHIQLSDGRVMAFAGLLFNKGERSHFVIVTSAATGALADIHHRTPHVLPATEWERWLSGSPAEAKQTFKPVSSDYFNAYPVSPEVGNVKADHAGLTEPYEAPPEPLKAQADLFG